MGAMPFESLSPSDLPLGRLYDLLACAVQPRPIAFVSTVDESGRPNLAPFSFFTAGGANPPSLAFCPSLTFDGDDKDSLRNAEATGEFVVSTVTGAIADAMNQTAASYPAGFDEFGISGLTPLPSVVVRPPRVAECPVHFECRTARVVRLGEGPHGTVYVIGEIVHLHVDSELWRSGAFEAASFRALGRMGGAEYVDLAGPRVFEMVRPKAPLQSSGEGSDRR